MSDSFRVKVYRLKDREWSDDGTGIVGVSNTGSDEGDAEPVVSVVDECINIQKLALRDERLPRGTNDQQL